MVTTYTEVNVSLQQSDSSTDGYSSIQFLTFIKYKNKNLYNYPIIAQCHTAENWRMRMIIIWNLCRFSNCCLKVAANIANIKGEKKEITFSTIKLEKAISLQGSKPNCLVIFFNLLENIRKRSSEILARVFDKVDRHLRVVQRTFLLWMIGRNKISLSTERIINLAKMLSNAFFFN